MNIADAAAWRQKAYGLATSLHARAKVAASEVQKVASGEAVKVGKGLREAQKSANKARVSAFKYVRFLAGCVIGAVAWTVKDTYQQIKAKGVKTWAVDFAHAAPEKARMAAGAAWEKASQLAIATKEMAQDQAFQATAASAAGGAVSLGTTGG